MSAEPEYHRQSPVGRWVVAVPIAEAGQKEETANDSRAGTLFTASRVRVVQHYGIPPRYILAGTNLLQSGRTGRLTVTRLVSRAYVAERYPEAFRVLMDALDAMKGMIRADAEEACREVERAARGDGEQE